jgi:hypothetical protein
LPSVALPSPRLVAPARHAMVPKIARRPRQAREQAAARAVTGAPEARQEPAAIRAMRAAPLVAVSRACPAPIQARCFATTLSRWRAARAMRPASARRAPPRVRRTAPASADAMANPIATRVKPIAQAPMCSQWGLVRKWRASSQRADLAVCSASFVRLTHRGARMPNSGRRSCGQFLSLDDNAS